MKLSRYLADYIEHEQEKHPRESGLVDLQEIIQQGIEAFASTEGTTIIVFTDSLITENYS